jgi:hypothetical protein
MIASGPSSCDFAERVGRSGQGLLKSVDSGTKYVSVPRQATVSDRKRRLMKQDMRRACHPVEAPTQIFSEPCLRQAERPRQ